LGFQLVDSKGVSQNYSFMHFKIFLKIIMTPPGPLEAYNKQPWLTSAIRKNMHINISLINLLTNIHLHEEGTYLALLD